MNTAHLLRKNVALKAMDYREALTLVEALLSHPTKLGQMQSIARECARPDSATRTANLILEKIGK
jgi:UDP-N-acetylglucosamine:LPS N-acetylglucosamine transferase